MSLIQEKSPNALAVAYAVKRRNKMACGGSVKNPHNVAKAIMMARGGMVNSEEALSKAQDYELGHEMHSEGSMDNESMPIDHDTQHDDFLSPESSDEEADGLHDLDHLKQRKSMLQRIMSDLHHGHFGK